jgi:sodium/potassium/calcium exchanger 6
MGNAAPDVASTLASFTQGGGTGDLALGSLLGAGMFVCGFVAAMVTLVGDVTVNRRPFLRDCGAYTIALLYLFTVMQTGNVTLAKSLGFLIVYCIFVAVVMIGRKLYQQQKEATLEEVGRILTLQPPP